jgi:hypothetical protein
MYRNLPVLLVFLYQIKQILPIQYLSQRKWTTLQDSAHNNALPLRLLVEKRAIIEKYLIIFPLLALNSLFMPCLILMIRKICCNFADNKGSFKIWFNVSVCTYISNYIS